MLSFDVEEFDMPLEYNFPITKEEQMKVGKLGLDALSGVLGVSGTRSTLFTTANFAQHFPDDMRSLAKRHEIASHTFYHSDFEEAHLLQSREALEQISGIPVTGLRMPRMRKVQMEAVREAGYQYDSSVNPTWLPGRYNNLNLPRTMYEDHGMIRIPASVSPLLRIPLFWLSFKNLPYSTFRWLTLQTLKKDGYVCLYFHPWEFTDIENYGLPGFTKKDHGAPLLDKLYRLLKDLASEAEAITMHDWLQMKSPATAGPF
jgi:peptidoglycan/xylan/chitin deacetylase (PgdA/CDA1 family)